MAGIPQNTSYDIAGKTMQGVINRISSITKNLPKRPKKAVDTSRYSSLANKVAGSTPAMVGGLGQVTVPYGGNTRYESYHPGVDIANKIGTPVSSFSPGTVVDVKTGQSQGMPGFGNYIVVEDSLGNKWRYSHLNKALVKVGQNIAAGTQIGEMGNTGSTYSVSGGTGSHLDLRIKDIYGRYINPSQLIKG